MPKKDHFARVRAIGARFPGVEESTSYGTPALKLRKKLLCRMKEDGETLVIKTANLDEKEFLIETEPAIFFETDHYKGWPAVLARLAKLSDKRLAQIVEKAWRDAATHKMIAEYDAKRG